MAEAGLCRQARMIIRAISDKADDSAEMDYPTFEAIAAQRCARVTMTVAKMLAQA